MIREHCDRCNRLLREEGICLEDEIVVEVMVKISGEYLVDHMQVCRTCAGELEDETQAWRTWCGD